MKITIENILITIIVDLFDLFINLYISQTLMK